MTAMVTASARVLVIDDDAAFRFAMVKALSRSGFAVAEASSGEAALSVLGGSDPPDAALLDLRMGGIDGLEVLKRCTHAPTRIEAYVLKDQGCVYDFAYAAPPASFEAWRADFRRFVESFAKD